MSLLKGENEKYVGDFYIQQYLNINTEEGTNNVSWYLQEDTNDDLQIIREDTDAQTTIPIITFGQTNTTISNNLVIDGGVDISSLTSDLDMNGFDILNCGDINLTSSSILMDGGLGNAKIEGNIGNSGRVGLFNAVGTELISLDTNNSYVGINKTSLLGYALDVGGDINNTGDYRISGTSVLNSTTLGSGVVNSSLTSVGTLETLRVSDGVNNTEIVIDNTNTVGYAQLQFQNDSDYRKAIVMGGSGTGVRADNLSVYDFGTSQHLVSISSTTMECENVNLDMNNNDITNATNITSTNNTVNGLSSVNYERINSNANMDTQGLHLQWNRGGDGASNIINHKGLGVGGIIFGERDTDTTYTEILKLETTGSLLSSDLDMNTNDISNIGSLGVGDTISTDDNRKIIIKDSVAAGDIGMMVHNQNGSVGNKASYNMSLSTGDTITGGIHNIETVSGFELGFNTFSGVSLNEKMRLTGQGKLGVNMTSPTYHLDVSGDINTSNDYRVSGTSVLNSTTLGSGVVNSSLTSVGTLTGLTVSGETTVVDGGSFRLKDNTGNPGFSVITDQSGEENCMILNNWGASTNTGFTCGTSRTDGTAFSVQNAIPITDGLPTGSGTSLMIVKSSGNVGIGTTNPSYDLDVVGDVNNTGDYRVSGTSVLNSTTLGSGVVNSSLTSVGTLTGLTVNGRTNTSTFKIDSNDNLANQGLHLQWNRGGDGRTNIINHKGLGVGGIIFGERDTDTTYTETMRVETTGATMAVGIDMGTNSITNATSITATNLTGTLQTAAQPNITSVGTLTSLTVSGVITSQVVYVQRERRTTQTIADATVDFVAWDTSVYTNSSYFSFPNSNRIQIATTGLYHIEASVVWDNNGTASREVSIDRHNAGNVLDGRFSITNVDATNASSMGVSALVPIATNNNFIYLRVYQDTGGNRTIGGTTISEYCRISIRRIGDL